jgi:predicted nucleotidyltransferase
MTPILRNMIADSDIPFARRIADGLRAVPGVTAIALGGSRAAGTHRPDSDWDFSLYYRGQFEPDDLRRTGWPGQIFPLGGWGGGVFNGGAWLRVDGIPVDIHYRYLNDVEFRLAEAREGRFRIERLPFHLAGIPTYIVVAELAVHVMLYGDLPVPGPYPAKLRESARKRWLADARNSLDYARSAHAAHSHLTETACAIALALVQAAHAILATRGEWVTNEKTLLDRAGLRRADALFAGLSGEAEALVRAVASARSMIEEATAIPGARG